MKEAMRKKLLGEVDLYLDNLELAIDHLHAVRRTAINAKASLLNSVRFANIGIPTIERETLLRPIVLGAKFDALLVLAAEHENWELDK